MAEEEKKKRITRYAKRRLKRAEVTDKPLIKHRKTECKCEECLAKRRMRLGLEPHKPFEKRRISFSAYKKLEERNQRRDIRRSITKRPRNRVAYRLERIAKDLERLATLVAIEFITSLGKEADKSSS